MSRHAAIELDWGDGTFTFRLGLAEIEELERKRDLSIFEIAKRLSPEVRLARSTDISETLRLGLIGGGLTPVDALAKVRKYVDERPLDENRDTAYAVILAGLMRVHFERDGEAIGGSAGGGAERIDFAAIYGNAALMGVQDVGSLSLGQWSAICRQRAKAHGDSKPDAPSEDEFDAAVMAARGVS